MKDVTFGVKVPEDLRDEINMLMKDSGLLGREFMQELVDSYMLDRHKEEIPEMSEEIKELQSLTHRINEMYLYLGTRFQDIIGQKEKEKQDINNQLDKDKDTLKLEIEKYKEEIKKEKEEKQAIQKELSSATIAKEEANAKINEISHYNDNYKELNKQYKNNIEKLNEKVSSLTYLKQENENLLKENKKLQENNDNMASDLWFSKREVEKLNNKIHDNKEEYKRAISRLQEQNNLEKQTAILEIQLKNQEIVEEYNEKLKRILFEIENNKIGDDKSEHRNNTAD